MEKRLNQFDKIVSDFIGDSGMAFSVIDNINIYRGTVTHFRIFKKLGPKMWNFTGRYLFKPHLDNIDPALFANREMWMDPQKPLNRVTVEDVLIDSGKHSDLLRIWNRHQHKYILELMKIGYQIVPENFKDLKGKGEKAFNTFINKNFPKNGKPERNKINGFMEVKVPECTKEFSATSNRKSEVLILPVSLQDESSITGVASIIGELSQILAIPMPEQENYLLFDPVKLSFDIEDARKRFIFLKSMEAYKIEHENILREHKLRDKAFASALEVDHDDIAGESTDADEMDTVPATSKRHLQELRKEIKDKESAFKTAYTNLKQQIAHASLSTDLGTMNLLVNNLKDKKDEKVMVTDQYERTFLHQAIEENNVTVSRVLLQIGCNPNAQEGCGATPLTLAVLGNSTDLCKLLVDHLASPEGVFVNKIPSPMKIATCLGYNHILDVFEKHCRKEDDLEIWESIYGGEDEQAIENDTGEDENLAEKFGELDCNDEGATSSSFSRNYCTQLMFGDVATTKNIRSARWNNLSRFSAISEVPGDFHCSGYLEECYAKAQGPGGLYYAVNKVSGRKKLGIKSYGKDKFAEGNYKHIKEANNDVAFGYSIAAVLKFRESELFPTDAELALATSNEELLVDRFLQWAVSGSVDVGFKYYMESVLYFGPLRTLFYEAIKCGNGISREVCYFLLLPVFAQLKKSNYFGETLVHLVNITAKWPLLTRLILRQNSSVNVSGKVNHNVAFDEYMETFVVRPLKSYISGKTTIRVLKAISGSTQLINSLRNVYLSEYGYGVHRTKKHSTAESLPDQLKVALFCLENDFFNIDKSRKKIRTYPVEAFSVKEGFVPNDRVEVSIKGQSKVKENFARRMFELYPECREKCMV